MLSSLKITFSMKWGHMELGRIRKKVVGKKVA
jgi:hypothetical protein